MFFVPSGTTAPLARAAAIVALAASVRSTAAAVDRSTWQAEANVTDPVAECTDYDFQPVNDIINNYPTIWVTATLNFTGALPADVALYDSLAPSIPAIAPRGTRAGDWTGITYNLTADPACWWTDTKCTTPKIAGIPADVTSCPEPNTWGFTLDDGPNCSHNAYYDYLREVEQKATLFYIGSNVADWPLEGQRGLADGHEICAHTWSHPYMTALTNEEVFAELYFSKKMIKDVLGVTVTCWRPPYGDVDDRVRFIAHALDMKTIIWDNDTDDWDYSIVGIPAVNANYADIINGSYSTHGTIVLSHELDNETMQLSQNHLPEIQRVFTGGVMPVGVCHNWTQIYGEGEGYQYPNYAEWVAGTRSISVAAPTAVSSDVAFATDAVVTSAGLPAGTTAQAAVTSGGSASKSKSGIESGATATASATASAVAGAQAAAAKTAAAAAAVRVERAFVAGAAVLAALIGGTAFLA